MNEHASNASPNQVSIAHPNLTTSFTLGGLTPLKIYLLAYNALSALLWSLILLQLLIFLFAPRGTSPTILSRLGLSPTPTVTLFGFKLPSAVVSSIDRLRGSYESTWWLVKPTQTLAVLEVVHAALGWVRSGWFVVGSQVFSRLWTVWGVVERCPEVRWGAF